MLRIKITKASLHNGRELWYEDLIGAEYNVRLYGGKYRIQSDNTDNYSLFILVKDADILGLVGEAQSLISLDIERLIDANCAVSWDTDEEWTLLYPILQMYYGNVCKSYTKCLKLIDNKTVYEEAHTSKGFDVIPAKDFIRNNIHRVKHSDIPDKIMAEHKIASDGIKEFHEDVQELCGEFFDSDVKMQFILASAIQRVIDKRSRDAAIDFLDELRAYERESGNKIGYDDRESGELYDLHLENQKLKKS